MHLTTPLVQHWWHAPHGRCAGQGSPPGGYTGNVWHFITENGSKESTPRPPATQRKGAAPPAPGVHRQLMHPEAQSRPWQRWQQQYRKEPPGHRSEAAGPDQRRLQAARCCQPDNARQSSALCRESSEFKQLPDKAARCRQPDKPRRRALLGCPSAAQR